MHVCVCACVCACVCVCEGACVCVCQEERQEKCTGGRRQLNMHVLLVSGGRV